MKDSGNERERGSGGTAAEVEGILRRDRRRVRGIIVVACIFWGLAILGVVLRTYFIVAYLEPKLVERLRDAAGAVEDLPQLVREIHMVLFAFTKESTILVSGTVLAVILAGITSVILVVASRRATLREVSMGLRQVSEQLRTLQSRG